MTACLYRRSCTSPAANTPLALVSEPFLTTTYPSPSVSTWPATTAVFGSWPMATNTPPARITSSPPVLELRTTTSETLPSPLISATSHDRCIVILGLARARSCIMRLARSPSLRCTTWTMGENFVRNVASSMAESPPPTTTISCPLKNGPSHVAQYETPRPARASSPFTPSLRGLAPVHMITASASYSSPCVSTFSGSRLKSTSTASSSSMAVPMSRACSRMSAMRSGPITPPLKPG